MKSLYTGVKSLDESMGKSLVGVRWVKRGATAAIPRRASSCVSEISPVYLVKMGVDIPSQSVVVAVGTCKHSRAVVGGHTPVVNAVSTGP